LKGFVEGIDLICDSANGGKYYEHGDFQMRLCHSSLYRGDFESAIDNQLTIGERFTLVTGMKMNDRQIRRVAQSILKGLKEQKVIQFKEKEEAVLARAEDYIRGDFQREAQLDQEVNKMMDDLERKNPGEFQRYLMFPMLKKRLAKEKKIIL